MAVVYVRSLFRPMDRAQATAELLQRIFAACGEELGQRSRADQLINRPPSTCKTLASD